MDKLHWLTSEEKDALGPSYIHSAANPAYIHKYKGKWYFWDETSTQCYGPFDTVQQADQTFANYAASIV